MKQSAALSMVVAVIMFFALCLVFSGAPDNAPLLAFFNPVEAVSGLSFALAFGAGIHIIAALVAAVAVFIAVPCTVFLVVRHFLRRYD